MYFTKFIVISALLFAGSFVFASGGNYDRRVIDSEPIVSSDISTDADLSNSSVVLITAGAATILGAAVLIRKKLKKK